MQHIVHHINGLFISHTQTVDELGFDVQFFQPGSDGFAAAVDDYRFHADRFHKDDIPHGFFDQVGIFHGAAAELDNNDFVPELLNVGQCFRQDIGFSDQFLHHDSVILSIRYDNQH